MFARIATGWDLVKQSLRVLRLDTELLLFPLVSGLACLAILASFAVPLWNSPRFQGILDEGQMPNDPLAYLVLFLFYFLNYFVIVFFNSALVACAIIRFKGENPTLGDGLRAATARFPQILAWALVSATIGLILRAIESRSEKVGQLVARLLGMAWAVTTYFVVPVLVVEKVGPLQAVQRSLAVLRKTWGEALGANLSANMIFFVVALVGFLPLLGALAIGALGMSTASIVLAVIGFGLALVVIVLVALVSSALHAILLAALYLYATEGTVPNEFDDNLLEHAFERRQ